MGIEFHRPRLLPALGLFTLFQASLCAQVVLSIHSGQWVQDRYAHHDFDSNVVAVLDEQSKIVDLVKLPSRESGKAQLSGDKPFQSSGPRFGKPYAWEDAWHIVRYARDAKDPKQVQVELLARQQGEWHPEATANLAGGMGTEVFPFGAKRHLLITRAALPQGASAKWSPFQVFRSNAKDQLEFDGVLDPELPGAVEQELRMESITFVPVLTDSHLILISPHRGRLWSFNLAKGRLERTRDLFTLPPTRVRTAFGPLPMYPIVLNVFPCADGTLTLMTRSARAVEELSAETERIQCQGRMTFEVTSKDQKAPAQARFQKEQDLAFGNNPILQWWNFHPVTGELKRLLCAPRGGVDMLHTEKALEAFNVRPLRNGDLAPLQPVLATPRQ
jgi:hypothetical protein